MSEPAATPPMESTHSSRHPLRPIIPPATVARPSGVTLQSRANVVAAQKRALQEDLKSHYDQQEASISSIAEKHGKKPCAIRKLVSNAPQLKGKRRPSLHNALIHFKAQELNAGLPKGKRYTAQEIRKAVDNDKELAEMSEEDITKLLEDFDAHRELTTIGVRASNRAATADYVRNTKSLFGEINQLQVRTGGVGFAFFARGHVDNSMQPTYFGSEERILNFIPDVLGMTPLELALKFDAWAVASSGEVGKNSLIEMQKDCSRTIVETLNQIIGKKKVEMAYSRYDTDIRARYHVELRGWPTNIPFRSPYEIGVADEIRRLIAMLKSGECHWAAMSRADIVALEASLKEQTRKPRKTRSDKNVPRGSRKPAAVTSRKGKEKENPPRKKARTAAMLPPMPKSQEYIDSSDDGDEDGDRAPLTPPPTQ